MTIPTVISPIPSIDLAHHRIHEGNHFTVHRIMTGVNVATPKYFLIKAPADNPQSSLTALIHLIYEVVSTNIGFTLETFEGPTITNNGTQLTVINNNRNSSTTPLTKVYEDPTITVDGTKIFEEITGTTTTGGTTAGELKRNDEEIILKVDTYYALKITPLANGLTGNLKLNWYDARPSTVS